MGKEEGTFLDYLSEARDEFVRKVNEQQWDTELRMASENILIAYDKVVAEYNYTKNLLNIAATFFNKTV